MAHKVGHIVGPRTWDTRWDMGHKVGHRTKIIHKTWQETKDRTGQDRTGQGDGRPGRRKGKAPGVVHGLDEHEGEDKTE